VEWNKAGTRGRRFDQRGRALGAPAIIRRTKSGAAASPEASSPFQLKGIGSRLKRKLSAPPKQMVFVLASAGIAAVAVGRSVYRHVMNFEPPAEPDSPSKHPPTKPRREESDQRWNIPDLDVPEGVMESLQAEGQLLLTSEDGIIQQLAAWLPTRHSIAKWTLLFSTALDGYSLATLYRKAVDRGPLLLLVRDVSGGLFGCYISHTLQQPNAGHSLGEGGVSAGTPGNNMSFHGHGETFLFEVLPMGHLPPLLDGSPPPPVSVCAYRWSHSDDLFVSSSLDFLAIGGGGSRYGLRLDADLQHGRTGSSATFKNPPLGAFPLRKHTDGPGADARAPLSAIAAAAGAAAIGGGESRFFDVGTVEIWSVDDWTLHHHVPQVCI
jgi:hypothetical protein